MLENPLTYPCTCMNLTQGYDTNFTHLDHWYETDYQDYPWDEACDDSARSALFCPCDEMVIKRIYLPTDSANTLWLESTTKVNLANGSYDYVVLLVAHPLKSDLNRLSVGQKFKRGDIICYEGDSGNATGNHFHFSVGKGKYSGSGWRENSNGAWVLTTTNGTLKPQEAFFIDPNFTIVKNDRGYNWIELDSTPQINGSLSGKTVYSFPVGDAVPPSSYSLPYVGQIKAPFDFTFNKIYFFAFYGVNTPYPIILATSDINSSFSRQVGKAWVGSIVELAELNIYKDRDIYIYSNYSSAVDQVKDWLNKIK